MEVNNTATPKLYFIIFLLFVVTSGGGAVPLTKSNSTSTSVANHGGGWSSLNGSISASGESNSSVSLSGNSNVNSNTNVGSYPGNYVSSGAYGYGTATGQFVNGNIDEGAESDGAVIIGYNQVLVDDESSTPFNDLTTDETNVALDSDAVASASASVAGSGSSANEALSSLQLSGGVSAGDNGNAYVDPPPPSIYGSSYANANGQVSGTGDFAQGSVNLNDSVGPSIFNGSTSQSHQSTG